MIPEVARALHREARATNERRMLVIHGDRDATIDAARTTLDAIGVLPQDSDDGTTSATLVSDRDVLPMSRVAPRPSEELLGTTQDAVVYDAHAECRPNAIGRVAGAVDGGGLLVFCTPSHDEWPALPDAFDDGLAVPPFDASEVTGHFRTRLVDLLRAHRGIAIVDIDRAVVEDDGLTNPAPSLRFEDASRTPTDSDSAGAYRADRTAVAGSSAPPDHRLFPGAAYDACLTTDQTRALATCEALRSGTSAVVLEANRGRGKSSAVGLAAACLARDGDDVLVTAPGFRNVAEVFARARELLASLGDLAESTETTDTIRTKHGGQLRFAKPPIAADSVNEPAAPDVLIVDEAAAVPVRLLDEFLTCGRVAFATTVHGYEGAGRGFDVRFRDHLDASSHDVSTVTLTDPIRYASGDPLEVWSFRALALDARPAVDPLIESATAETTTYRELSPVDLTEDEHLLREAFGLLVYAHYRTEPNDLARLLDAPNLTARALMQDGHVAAVALLAREGGLDEDLRADMYEGGRVKGNMLPDVLTSQLRDEAAARPVGYRVMRIATHPVCRHRGLGSRLLSEVRAEFETAVDWLGVGYGATPGLVDFWTQNGYSTVHLSTTRNDTSGEYSAIMLDPTSHLGEQLHDRHAGWFARRIAGVMNDSLQDIDVDVARACLAACNTTPDLELTDDDWRLIAACAYGPAMYAVDPDPFTILATHHLVVGDPELLTDDQERLLVAATMQRRPWQDIASELSYHSHSTAMRAFGRALQPLVDEYGSAAAADEMSRHRD